MKAFQVLFLGLLSIFIVSCSNLEMGFEEDSMFYSGGVLYIYLDEVDAKEGEYKIYINKEDTEVSLTNHFKTRFGIIPGQTTIEVISGLKKASIDIFLQKSNSYYLRVIIGNNGALVLKQVQSSDIDAGAEQTSLYVDENIDEKTKNSKVLEAQKKPLKSSKNDTTVSYDENAGWE